MSWPLVVLADVLSRSLESTAIDPDRTYKLVTVRMWGKGIAERTRVPGSEMNGPRRPMVRKGQLLLSKIDARHGALGIVPAELDGAVVSNDFPSFDIDPSRAMPGYVGWLVRSAAFVRLCERASAGSTNRVRLREDKFLALALPFPTLETQASVSARLRSIESAAVGIAGHAQRQTAIASSLLRGLFERLTSDAPRLPMTQVAPLVRRAVDVDPSVEYPELGVRSFGRGTFHKPAVLGADFGSKRVFWIEPNDLVFNIVFAWEGAVAVASEEDRGRVGSHRFLACVPGPGLALAEYLRYYFLTPEGLGALGRASPGGAGRNRTLSMAGLGEIRVPVPAFDAQSYFAARLADIERLANLWSHGAETSTELIATTIEETIWGPGTPPPGDPFAESLL